MDSLKRHGETIKDHGSPFRNSLASLDIDGELIFEESEPRSTQNRDTVSLKLHDYARGAKKRQDDFDEEEELKKEKMKKKVLEWISALKETESLHKRFQDTKICPDSGRWLFKRYSEITEWMEEDLPPESAIWLHGSRGYGKNDSEFKSIIC